MFKTAQTRKMNYAIQTMLSLVAICFAASCASKNTTSTSSPTATTTASAPAANTPAATTTPLTKTNSKNSKQSSAAAVASASASKLTCTSGKEVRTLEIKSETGKACDLIYTKGGESKSLASAKSDTAYCQKIIEKVSKNLSSAGYKCE